MINGRNELIPFTRRYPQLKEKQKIRDSKIAKRIVSAWDVEQSQEKVLEVFSKENSQLSDPRYWELLKSTWIVSGSVKNADIFRLWMKSTRGYKSYFMTPEEKVILDSMPDNIMAYRAFNEGEIGLSWTTSEEYAQHFKKMFNKQAIMCRLFEKKDIFAFINRNDESELLILNYY